VHCLTVGILSIHYPSVVHRDSRRDRVGLWS